MSIVSNWSLIWDSGGGTAMQVLAIGQEIDAEPEWPWEQEHEDRQVVEGAGTEPLPRELVRGSLTITVYKEHADDATARAYIFSHRSSIHARKGLRKALLVSWDGGSASIANAIFKSAIPRMSVDDDVARTATTYTFLFPS